MKIFLKILSFFCFISLLVLGVVFSLQNSDAFVLKFFTYQSKPTPIWVVGIVAFILGTLLTVIYLIGIFLKQHGLLRKLNKKVFLLEKELYLHHNKHLTGMDEPEDFIMKSDEELENPKTEQSEEE